MPTPHNAARMGEIAKTVLMPGDPLRAKYIAEHYLTDVVCYNYRTQYAWLYRLLQGQANLGPGQRHGHSVHRHLLSRALYNVWGDNIIRIGSAGAIAEDVHIRDIVIGMGALH